MNWLVIDTSTSVLGIAVMNEERVWGELATDLERHHSERLLPAIRHMLRETQLTVHEIEGIAVVRGPGSYTGLRIGVTAAKTFAWSLQVPLIGVSSLAALAMNGQRFPGRLIPMWDARRERVYTGQYEIDQSGACVSVIDDFVTPVSDWASRLASEPGTCLFLGNGAAVYRALIEAQLGEKAVFACATENVVRPAAIGRLAINAWKKRGSDDVAHFVPEYLQKTEAEVKWEKRQ